MSDPVNKWDQPESAPPPMFFGKKERDLVKQVNDELAERVVGQTIAYYSVSLEDSEFHPIYGEAIDKVTLPPIRVYAYVTVENEQSNERYGYEYQTKLTVNFNRKRLTEDQNLFVRVGDFVQYGDEFYEVVKTYNDTRYYFGQIEHKFQISAECIKARQGNFRIRGEMKPQLVTTAPGVKPVVEPAAAPPPVVPRAPNNAEYLVLTADAALTKERVFTAGDNITFTDTGAGGTLTIAATGDLAVSSSALVYSSLGLESSGYLKVTGSTTLTGPLSSSAAARLVGSLSSSGDVAVTGTIHATTYYGDGSNLAGVGSNASGSARQYSATGIETSGYLKVTGSATLAGDVSSSAGATWVSSVSSSGDVAITGALHAATLYGDGSGLSGVLTSMSGTARQYSATGVETSGYLKVTGSTTLAGTLSSSAGGALVGSLSSSGDVAVSGNVHATAYYGDGSSLSGITSTPSGSSRHYSATGFETSGYLKVTGSTILAGAVSSSAGAALVGSVSSSGDVAVTGNVHAGAYYGDGSNLAGVSDASGSARHYSSTGLETSGYLKVSGSTTLADLLSSSAGAMFRGNAEFAGTVEATGNLSASAGNFEGLIGTSLNLQNGGISNAGPLAGVTTATLSGFLSSSAAAQIVGNSILGGALNISGTIAAAGVASGTLAGSGSFIGLNSANQFVLTGAGEPVSGAIRHYSATGLETSGYLRVSGSTALADSLSSSAGAVFDSSISSSGDLAVSGNAHATAYYGDGSNLSGIAGTASGSARHYSSTGVETSGYLKVSGSTTLADSLSSSAGAVLVGSVSSSGDMAITGNVHATAYYGDGSNLSGIAGTASGSARHYSSTGVETSGYLRVTGSTTLGGAISSSAAARLVGSLSSSANVAVTGNVHATTYYGDGSQLSGIGSAAASGSALHYSATGMITSGYLKVSGSTTLAGGVTHNLTTITAASYTLLETDFYLAVDTSSNAVTLTLPNACVDIAGHTYVVKDVGGNAATNSITIDGYEAETIDGQASFEIDSPYGSVGLFNNGVAWFIY